MQELRRRSNYLAVCAMLVFLGCSASAQEPIQYELRFGKPNTHLMDVTIRATGLKGSAVEFAMPAWAPGSYGINDYAANVQGFRAANASGKALNWRKTDKQTWRVEIGGESSVTIGYKLYANTLANNQAQYNEQHVFIGGPAVWMYLVGGKERNVRLKVETPTGRPATAAWRVATGMKRVAENTFEAADYDWLADSPIEISDYVEQTFEVGGTTYHLSVHDVMGRKDFTKFTQDSKKFVQELVRMMAQAGGGQRGAPFADYWFIYHIWPGGRGGLEHLNSTQINYSTDWDDQRPYDRYSSAYEEKLSVASHEFFHAWNVKRLRPKQLGPFDYSREVHTTSLWFSEGLTSYWGDLALLRAGLMTQETYLRSVEILISEFEQQPGRQERSIEETSWDTWFRPSNLRADTNLLNTQYSYYDGGQIIGHLLDFAIRQATENKKSLDDWLRLLYERNAWPKPGFEAEDLIHAASEVAGRDMSDFFRRYVSGKEPLPYEQYFAYAGIAVQRREAPEIPWLGILTTRNEDGNARITNVIPGSPAEDAGLDRGDIVVALNGKTKSIEALQKAIEEGKPGESMNLTVIRLGQLKDITARLGAYPYRIYRLEPMEKMSSSQKKMYESWIGKK